MSWQQTTVLLFVVPIIMGYQMGPGVWKPKFFRVLSTLKGPEGVALRQKYMAEISLLAQDQSPDDVMECPDRILTVLKALCGENGTKDIEIKLRMHQFKLNLVIAPQTLESVLQQNCSMLPEIYVHSCQLLLARAHPAHLSSDILNEIAGKGKCYQERLGASNTRLTHR